MRCCYKRSNHVYCRNHAGHNSSLCKYHLQEGRQLTRHMFLDVQHGVIRSTLDVTPETGDMKFDSKNVYKYTNSNRWVKCCKMCWQFGRPWFCNTHNPSTLSWPSLNACLFMDMLSEELKFGIAHKHVSGSTSIILHQNSEVNIPGTPFRVDGYCSETKTVYEFLGDFWHGNPDLYNKDKINSKVGKKFQVLFEETFERLQQIAKLGFRVFYVWEKDFACFLKDPQGKTVVDLLTRVK